MSIQKKSLISTLKTAKKANVASTSAHDAEAKGSKVSSMRLQVTKGLGVVSTKNSMRALRGTFMKSTRLSGKTIS